MESETPNISLDHASMNSHASLASIKSVPLETDGSSKTSLEYDRSNSEGFARVTSQRTWTSEHLFTKPESYEVLAEIDVNKMGKIQEDFLVKGHESDVS